MANIKSAKKRAKQNIVRRKRNLSRSTDIKTITKKVLAVVDKGEDATELLKKAEAKIARAKSKGLFHSNTAARKISRLSKKVAAIDKKTKTKAAKATKEKTTKKTEE